MVIEEQIEYLIRRHVFKNKSKEKDKRAAVKKTRG